MAVLVSSAYHTYRARLAALYSDFRHLRTTNPDGYAANVEAWQKGLSNAAVSGHIPNHGSSGDLLILKVDEELLRQLDTKEWGRPLALGTVVRESVAKKEFIPLRDFLTAKESVYHRSWVVTPWQVVSWGLRQLGLAGGEGGEDILPVGKLVILSNLESASKELEKSSRQHATRTDRIYSKILFTKTFMNLLGDNTGMSQADMDVFLRFLSRDKGSIAYDGQTIKFKGSSQTDAIISPEDSTIASLKTLMMDLESQINILAKRIDVLALSAREAVTRKNKVSALSSLRSKKIAETYLSQQSATLSRLEEVYNKIEQAADQVELVRIMQGSTGVLRTLNAEVGGVERVDYLVDELKEQMTQVDEIGNVIAEVGQAGTMVDEDEVDSELEAMEADDRRKREEVERLERDKKEAQEIEQTKRKLDELEATERKAAAAAFVNGKSEEKLVEESTDELKKMSLEEIS